MDVSAAKSMMIGSMPQKAAAEALDLLREFPLSVPTWPQLPKRSFKEGMIPQYSEGFPGISIDEVEKRIWIQQDDRLMESIPQFYENFISENWDSFSISREFAGGLTAFLENMRESGEKVPVIKGQVTGPFTFGLGLNDQTGKAVWFDPQYRDVVLKGITAKGVWLFEQLKELGQQVLIFFDEPILMALGTPAYIGIQDDDVINGLNEVIDALHQRGARVGIHCCGNMDWGLLSRTHVDIIAFDAYFYGDKVALYPGEIKDFLNRGGSLAWGLVPTDDSATLQGESPAGLLKVFEERVKLFVEKGLPEEKLLKQLYFSPSCGFGSLSVDDSRKVLELLGSISS